MEYGLIGEKLGHSFSKTIHNQIADYEYTLREVSRSQFSYFMEGRDFKAINVTIPYKQDVIPYLYYIDDAAREIGAVNCIVNKDDRLYGYNTDFLGARDMILYAGIEMSGKKVLILGTGGTSKTLTHVAKSMGASRIIIVSRQASDSSITYEDACAYHSDADIIINTTPVGMYPNNYQSPISCQHFHKLSGVVDVVYNPLKTQLILDAEKHGIKTTCGLYMLVAQAVYAAALFDPSLFEDKEKDYIHTLIDNIFKKTLSEKQNIVLTGMPSCGKSTLGYYLSQKTGYQYFDTDLLIKSKEHKEIPDIFNEVGESGFREIESQVVKEIAKKSGIIISTGGGAVLNPENIDALKQNGRIYFIDRSLENLKTTSDRPLSSDFASLKKRYDERYHIYCSTCDMRINGDQTIQDEVNEIYEASRTQRTKP